MGSGAWAPIWLKGHRVGPVIVAIDNTAASEQTVAAGAFAASTLGVELVLAAMSIDGKAGDAAVMEPRWMAAVGQAPRATGRAGLTQPVRAVELHGAPGDALLQLSASLNAAMLVLRQPPAPRLDGESRGNVLEIVLRHGQRPVMLIPEVSKPFHIPPRRLLLPLDGSALAESALPLAKTLARHGDATLGLTRVISPAWQRGARNAAHVSNSPAAADLVEVEARLEHDARAYLQIWAERVRDEGLRVSWEIRVGPAADEILRTATTTAADMLVVATRGWSRAPVAGQLGSVTADLAMRAPIPILIIPPAPSDVRRGAASDARNHHSA